VDPKVISVGDLLIDVRLDRLYRLAELGQLSLDDFPQAGKQDLLNQAPPGGTNPLGNQSDNPAWPGATERGWERSGNATPTTVFIA
jgi:hypothetical protein